MRSEGWMRQLSAAVRMVGAVYSIVVVVVFLGGIWC